jgi:hypothetical protein
MSYVLVGVICFALGRLPALLRERRVTYTVNPDPPRFSDAQLAEIRRAFRHQIRADRFPVV